MQGELTTAGERICEMAQSVVQLEREEAEQRGLAQQAQQDASRLQGEIQSLSEDLAQRDSDLQVIPGTFDPLSGMIQCLRSGAMLYVGENVSPIVTSHMYCRGTLYRG